VIVDDRLLREARRAAEAWRSLQELGGIRNSHAERALAREREKGEEARAAVAPAPTPAPEAAASAVASAAPAEAAPERPADEPYIETPRCSSCDECIQINGKMFAYDANKQARIVDAGAGTYRQLVEAAESCQVAIIHPGKPKNPGEPGLDELLKRAEAFP
jgi:ferredoxin